MSSRTDYHAWLNKVEADFEASEYGKRLKAHCINWSAYHTGGGCLAAHWGDGDWYFLMSDDDGYLPSAAHPVVTSFYFEPSANSTDEDEDGSRDYWVSVSGTIDDGLAFCDAVTDWLRSRSALPLLAWIAASDKPQAIRDLFANATSEGL